MQISRWPLPVFAALLGTAYGVALTFGLAPLLLVFLGLLILRVKNQENKFQAWLAGWCFGALGFSIPVLWLRPVLVEHGGLTPGVSWLAALALAVFLGLFSALFLGGIHFIRKSSWFLLALPSMWMLMLAARTFGPAPFPWLPLSAIWFQGNMGRWLLPWIGGIGLDGLLFLGLGLMLHVPESSWKITSWPRSRWLGLFLILFCSLPFQPAVKDNQSKPLQVVVVQPNVAQAMKWTQEQAAEIHQRINTLAIQAAKNNPQASLLVLPETCLPYAYSPGRGLDRSVRQLQDMLAMDLLIGLNHKHEDQTSGNAAVLFSEQNQPSQPGLYEKQWLTPFGEYVPFAGMLSFLGPLTKHVGDFQPGKASAGTLDWRGQTLGMLICYEAAFPHLASARARQGSTVLVNLTNDAWFGNSIGPQQHLLHARIRAVETGLPLIRCANTGISGLATPGGSFQDAITLNEQGVALLSVAPGSATFFARTAYWQQILWLIPGVLVCVLSFVGLIRQDHGTR